MAHQHIVKRGDCISSIAFEHGFFPETLWQHAANAGLRARRASPQMLLEGDAVHVPDKRAKTCAAATDARHRFRRFGVPSRLRLKIERDRRARPGVPFTLELDGAPFSTGVTSAGGYVDVYISPSAQHARLTVGSDDDLRVYELALGHTEPASELTGVQQRLRNLGLYHGELDGAASDDLAAALCELQAASGLPATGELDEPTRAAIVAAHGS